MPCLAHGSILEVWIWDEGDGTPNLIKTAQNLSFLENMVKEVNNTSNLQLESYKTIFSVRIYSYLIEIS